ncbi:MAG TPA: lamin tail domain-containing protein, partial [Tepidisphaeraceae bacterium]
MGKNGGRRRATRGAAGLVEELERRVLLAAATTPIINEFLAVNDSGLTDQDGQNSDWIEIYNPTGSAVNLNGWRLTDTSDDPSTWWTFPAVTLNPDKYLVVFASGKDRRVAGQ